MKKRGLSLPSIMLIIFGVIALILLFFFLYPSITNLIEQNSNSNKENLQNSLTNQGDKINNESNIIGSVRTISNCIPIDSPCNLQKCGIVDNGCGSINCGNCGNTEGCINGVCVSNPATNCRGTNKGLDFVNKGTTTYYGSSYTDYCAPDNIGIYKYSCNLDGTIMGGYYNCKSYGYDSCSNGACIRGTTNIPDINTPKNNLSLLLFISPQYSNDNLIINTINQYQDSLKKEGFSSKIIKLTNSENTIGQIRKIILTEVKNDNSVKAGLFIGEDIVSFVIRSPNIESPQYSPWEILDNPINYVNVSADFSSEILPSYSIFQPSDDPFIFDDMYARADRVWFVADDQGILPNPDFFVSFLMPPENQLFNQRRDKIIFALDKFTQYHDNKIDYGNTIHYEIYNFSFENNPGSTPIISLSSFNVLGNLIGQITGPNSECLFDYSTNYKAFLAWGHGDPHEVWASCEVYSQNLSSIKTPLVIVSGCNTGGWYTNASGRYIDEHYEFYPGGRKTHVYNALMPPNFQYTEKKLLSESIFDSNNLIALESGVIQTGNQKFEKDYIDRFTYSLESGKTLAEAHLSGGSYGTLWFYGDPFFHY